MENKFNTEKFKWTMYALGVISIMITGQVAHDLNSKIQWTLGLMIVSAIVATWFASPTKPKKAVDIETKLYGIACTAIVTMIGIAYFGGNGMAAGWFVVGLLAIGTAASVFTDKLGEVVTYTVAAAIPLLMVSLLLCQEVALTGVSTLS